MEEKLKLLADDKKVLKELLDVAESMQAFYTVSPVFSFCSAAIHRRAPSTSRCIVAHGTHRSEVQRTLKHGTTWPPRALLTECGLERG